MLTYLIFAATVAGLNSIELGDLTGILTPILHVTDKDSKTLMKWIEEVDHLLVQIDSSEVNWWHQMGDSALVWVYYSIFLGGISLFLIGYASYKWYIFVKLQGFGYTMPNVVLPIEIIANLCTRLGLALWSMEFLLLPLKSASFLRHSGPNTVETNLALCCGPSLLDSLLPI